MLDAFRVDAVRQAAPDRPLHRNHGRLQSGHCRIGSLDRDHLVGIAVDQEHGRPADRLRKQALGAEQSARVAEHAGECLRPADSLAHRAPWAVTFSFGLLHGLGFASSLLDIGLPEKHVPTALLFFNVGVEIGQLGVIALVLALSLLAARVPVQPATVRRGLVYAMGGMAGYWSIERIVATLTGASL